MACLDGFGRTPSRRYTASACLTGFGRTPSRRYTATACLAGFGRTPSPRYSGTCCQRCHRCKPANLRLGIIGSINPGKAIRHNIIGYVMARFMAANTIIGR